MDSDAERRKRVLDGLGDEGGDGDGAGLADAFDAERVQRAGRFEVRDFNVWYLDGGRHQKVHEAGIDELAAVVEEEAFVESARDALRHATVDLALDDGRVDEHATVVDHDVAD